MQTSHAVQVIIAFGILAVTGIARAQSNAEVPLPLPAGVSIESATAKQLATAVGKAVRSNPSQAAAIVAKAIGGLTSDDKEKAAAIITAALMAGKGADILAIVRAASAANPALAPTVAATAAELFPKLAAAIARAAAEGAPKEARAIALAVAEVVPDQRDLIFASIRSSGLPRLDLGALGFATGQGINPANFVGGQGATGRQTTGSQSTEPSEEGSAPARGAQPSPSPTSSRPPLLGGEIITPES